MRALGIGAAGLQVERTFRVSPLNLEAGARGNLPIEKLCLVYGKCRGTSLPRIGFRRPIAV